MMAVVYVCRNEKKCLNYPRRCTACCAAADFLNPYPLFKDKALIDSGLYEALKDIVWYNDHTEWLVKLRNDIEASQKEGDLTYGIPLDVEEWHTEKHMIWMLLVGVFGSWGTSIRSGWIENLGGCVTFIDGLIADKEGQ